MLFLSTLRMWRHQLVAGRARPMCERKRTPMVRKRKPIVELLEDRVPMGTVFNGFGLGSANVLPLGMSLPEGQASRAVHAISETPARRDIQTNAAAQSTSILAFASSLSSVGAASQIAGGIGSAITDNDPMSFENQPTTSGSGGGESAPPNLSLHPSFPAIFGALPVETPHTPTNGTNPTMSPSAGKPGNDALLFQAVSAAAVKTPPQGPKPLSAPSGGGGGGTTTDPTPTWTGWPPANTKLMSLKNHVNNPHTGTAFHTGQPAVLSRSQFNHVFGGVTRQASPNTRLSPTATRTSSTSSLVGPIQDASAFIGTFGADEFEVSITINPTNTNNIVVLTNAQIAGDTVGSAGGLMFSYTMDGGTTWNPRYIATGDDNFANAACCDPSAAFDRFGNLWFSYVDFSPDNDSTVVNLSTDGGITLRTVFDYLDASNTAIDQPKLAVGDNSVWVVWADVATSSEPDYRLQTADAYIGGLNNFQGFFGIQDMPLSPDLTFQNFGKIAVGPNGVVMVTWVNPQSSGEPQSIFGDVDLLGTRGSWGTPFLISSTNVGSFLSIPPQAARTIAPEPEPAYDRSGGTFNGRAYVVYTDRANLVTNATDIFVRHSDNNGATWSIPTRVTDVLSPESRFFPRIQVDQSTGHIAVSWLDARNDPTDQSVEEFIAFSDDGGNTFSSNIQVASAPSNANITTFQKSLNDFGDFTGLSFVNGVARPAWPDNSTDIASVNLDAPNTFDIATAAVQDPFLSGGGGGGGSFSDTLFSGGLDNDTSDTSLNEGSLSSSANVNNVSLGANGTADTFPDVDFFQWTMSRSGTFTATETATASGPFELHLFKLVNGSLVDEGDATGQNTVQTLSTSVSANDTIYVEVKGINTAPGVFTTGTYNLQVSLA
jgi:hypothetical protein